MLHVHMLLVPVMEFRCGYLKTSEDTSCSTPSGQKNGGTVRLGKRYPKKNMIVSRVHADFFYPGCCNGHKGLRETRFSFLKVNETWVWKLHVFVQLAASPSYPHAFNTRHTKMPAPSGTSNLLSCGMSKARFRDRTSCVAPRVPFQGGVVVFATFCHRPCRILKVVCPGKGITQGRHTG